mgnify:CR=1 FL=1
MPLPMFTVLIPKDKSYIQHVPKGRFSKPIGSRFRNDDFVDGQGISEQPKDSYYNNSEAYDKV